MLTEISIPRWLLGRLLRRRPIFVSYRTIQGRTRRRLILLDLSETRREGYEHLASAELLLRRADIIKVYAPNMIECFFPKHPRPTQQELGTLALTYPEAIPREYVIVIVGCGRAGSAVAAALRKEGFWGRLVLVDPDEVTDRILPPYWDARPGEPKTRALARYLQRGTEPKPEVIPIPRSIAELRKEDLELVADADWIFIAVDDWAARFEANRLAMGFGIPATMLGVAVIPGRPPGFYGQIEIYIPGEHCLECLQRAAPEAGALLDGLRRAFWGEPPPGRQPTEPVLSELLAAEAVLLWRQALARGRVLPRYEIALYEGHFRVEGVDPPVAPECPVCRSRSGGEPPVIPRLREGARERRRLDLMRRIATWTGAVLAGITAELLGLGIALGISLFIALLAGYRGWRAEYYTPLEYWLRFNTRGAETTLGTHFGLLIGAVLSVVIPYLLLPWPLYAARRAFTWIDSVFVSRLLRREILTAPVPRLDIPQRRLHVGPRARRNLERVGQGLMSLALALAFFLLLPSFRAMGIFWAYSLSFMFPFFVGAALFYWARFQLRTITHLIRATAP